MEQIGNLDQITPNLYNFICYDPLKGYLWNVKCYSGDGVQLVDNVTFKSSKKILFEENLAIWASLKCHLNVLKVSVELSL